MGRLPSSRTRPPGGTGHKVDGSLGYNTAPTVAVSANPTTVDSAGSVTLTPTVPDGQNNVTSYLWTSNGDGTFADDDAANTTWTAPAVTGTNRSVSPTLTLTDGGGLTGTAFRAVTVRTAPSVTVAASATWVAGGGDLTLDGTASSPSGNLTYSWSSTGGGTFGDASAADTTWTAPAAAASVQSVTLTVTDTTTGLVTSYAVTVTGGRIPVQPCGAVAGAAPRGVGVPRRGRPFLSRHRPVCADLPGAGPRVGRRVPQCLCRGPRVDRPAGGGGGHRGRNPHAHRHPRGRRGRRRRDIHLHAEIYSGCQSSHWRRNTAANRSSGSR